MALRNPVRATGLGRVQVPFMVNGLQVVVEFDRRQWRKLEGQVQEAFMCDAFERQDTEAIRDINRWESVT